MFSLILLLSCTDNGNRSTVTGADPGVLEAPIAFVKRPVPVDDDGDEIQSDLREPLFFAQGGDVYIRSNSTVTAVEKNITAMITEGQGDVKDLQPNFEGNKFLFTLRLFDPNPNDDDTPSWNIYEYDLELSSLRRVIDENLDLIAELGDDVMPAYLPDGRIIFSSNRQTQSGEILTNESKPRFKALDEDEDTFAMVLHVMNEDGTDIHQISFNQSHDLYPTVLSNNFSGQVLYTRWDNAAGNNAMHLYKMNPDGTDMEILYGRHSHDTGNNNSGSNDATIQFSQPEEMEDGRIMVIARPYNGTYGGGDIVIIDIANYVNNDQPIASMAGLSGTAQISATINNVSTENELSLAGRYSSAFPLWDGSQRVLVSKSNCELIVRDEPRACIEPYLSDEDAEEASPLYSIWLYDLSSDSEKIIVTAERGQVIDDIIALQARSRPLLVRDDSDDLFNLSWKTEGIGVIHIKSVYDFSMGSFDGCFFTDCSDAAVTTVSDLGNPLNATANQRPARFVRFIKAVSLPDEDDPDLENAPDLDRAAFGPQRNLGMREIIGYAPVEPDGSVKVKVPANIALAIEVLDKNGRRIGDRHHNWFQVRPGNTMECTGCHTNATLNNETPAVHHRKDAEVATINSGIPAIGEFVNTLIPGEAIAYWGNPGETMAQVRFRLATNKPQVSADIRYQDYWTDPAVRAVDESFSYEYASLETPSPANEACNEWNFKCRILINYEQHIHPLWSFSRDDGVEDNTCTRCHTNFDEVLLLDQVPAAQLDLSDGFSDQEPEQFKSYRELFSRDAGEELDALGFLVNIQIEQTVAIVDADGNPVLDMDGNPTFDIILIDDPAAQTRPGMSGNGARASHFLEKMTQTELNAGRVLLSATDPNYVDHAGFMTVDELRLISEWLDIGAQYFNDPFDPDAPN